MIVEATLFSIEKLKNKNNSEVLKSSFIIGFLDFSVIVGNGQTLIQRHILGINLAIEKKLIAKRD